jgi:endonuclease-8
MPEGHTIHRIAKDHGALLTGRTVAVTSPQGRFADAVMVDGQTLDRLEAMGKHLWYHWSNGLIGHVHLGLFGKFGAQSVNVVGYEPHELRVSRLGANPLLEAGQSGRE